MFCILKVEIQVLCNKKYTDFFKLEFINIKVMKDKILDFLDVAQAYDLQLIKIT